MAELYQFVLNFLDLYIMKLHTLSLIEKKEKIKCKIYDWKIPLFDHIFIGLWCLFLKEFQKEIIIIIKSGVKISI